MLAKAFLLMLDSMAKPLIVNDAKVGGEGIVDGGGDAAHLYVCKGVVGDIKIGVWGPCLNSTKVLNSGSRKFQ